MSISDVAERLVLDDSKIQYHMDRVKQWDRGERIAPITIDMALTQACTAGCGFCIRGDQRILLSGGLSVPIKEIKTGDCVVSLGKDGSLSTSIVTASWMSHPNKKTLTIFVQGDMLVCTYDHPILTRQGWKLAGQLTPGEKIACIPGRSRRHVRKDDWRQKPDEESRRCQASRRNHEASARQEDFRMVETHVEGWTNEPDGHGDGKQESRRQENERKQSDATQGGCREITEFLFAGKKEVLVGKNEIVLENRGNKAKDLWTGNKQSGEDIECHVGPDGIYLHGGRKVLGQSDQERYSEKSRFHVHGAERFAPGCSLEFNVSSPGQREIRSGNGRLHCGKMECVGSLVKEPDYVASSRRSREDRLRGVVYCKVESIEASSSCPVYDIECWPHHNFIASGVVVHNCYAALQANKPRRITTEIMRQFLDDCFEIGVKAVSFVSDGESTLSPAYAPSIEHGHFIGLDMASGTWGGPLTRPIIDRVLPCLTYLRFNISGGTPERTAEIMGISIPQHLKVLETVRYCVDRKAERGLGVTIGIQMVLRPQDADQIIPFAKLGVSLGVTYAIIKHCSDDESGSLGVDYDKYPLFYDKLQEAESLSTDTTKVVIKWNKIKQGGTNRRPYDRCFGPPFIMQISGSGLVAPCGMLFNEKYSRFHIGNICKTRFKDIWQSEKYWEVMNLIADPNRFDPRKACGSLCLQDRTNVALWNHKVNGVSLVEPSEADPAHVNFV